MKNTILSRNHAAIARLASAALAALLLAFLAACGGGDEEASAPEDGSAPADEPAVFTAEEAQQAAAASLLTQQDFPAGWTSQPAEADDDDDFGPEGLPPNCALIFADDDETDDDTVSEAVSDDFVGLNDEEVSSEVSVMKSARVAEFRFDTLEGFFGECSEPLEAAFQRMFEEEFAAEQAAEGEPVDVQISNFSFTEQSFPDYGDDTMAMQIAFTMQAAFIGFDMEVDLIFVRVGPMMGTVTYSAFLEPLDPALEEQFVGLVADRMAASSAGLAD